jgi:DNA repair protein RadD
VDYRTGLNSYREWICLEHAGYARAKAESWWLRRAPAPVPGSVDAALERVRDLSEPSHIRIRTKGKFTEISGHRFDARMLAA